MKSTHILRYIALGIILVLLGGLGAWYLFLKNERSTISEVSAGRGFGTIAPSFDNPGGSTLENIVAGLGFQGERPPQSEEKRRLFQVQKAPVAGFSFIATSSTSVIRFMERSTGYLFDVNVASNALERLTQTLVPKALYAEFTKGGSVVAFAPTGEGAIVAFTAEVGKATSTGFAPLIEHSLGESVFHARPTPGSDSVLALVRGATGATVVRSELDGSKPQQVVSLGTEGWHLFPLAQKTIVSERSATGVASSAYEIVNGSLSPLVRGVPGLTLLPHPTLPYVLVGSDTSTLTLSILNTQTRETRTVPIRSIAEKCVWAPYSSTRSDTTTAPHFFCAVPNETASRTFLDSWYRGTLHTSDTWWRVNAETGEAQVFFSPQNEFSLSLDVERPAIDDRGNYLGFMNRRDQSLWVLRLEQ